ncbi:hypothetical protein [Candidatus Frankia alpina]|uniref:hypothetical protein n=1 Tax=Candidatus Frankia alpina TaxID=2699483 RepID=UPI0013D155C0|nr:hypothetical protein [Candidatus Frankia alpina]
MTSRRRRLLGALATVVGTVLRIGPGIAGPALVAAGIGMIYLPAGLIAAGGVLWLIDWRTP